MPINVVLLERAFSQEKQGLCPAFLGYLGRCRLTVENVLRRVSCLSLDADVLESQASIFVRSQQGKQGFCSTFLGRRRLPLV